jgi:hypothetical protein
MLGLAHMLSDLCSESGPHFKMKELMLLYIKEAILENYMEKKTLHGGITLTSEFSHELN